jgi:GH18 family chitinase
LSVLRSKLGKDKSLSIAAPASFWYLKQFPIAGIAMIVDYIVYMTYDLHGQWDAANKWANPGCPSGSCLRNQVNLTETISALVST